MRLTLDSQQYEITRRREAEFSVNGWVNQEVTPQYMGQSSPGSWPL